MRTALVVTDLDDTLLCGGGISEKTAAAFARLRAAGIPAAFATARFETREFAQRLYTGYSINTDGTLILTTEGIVIHKWTFPEADTDCILGDILSESPETDIIIPTVDGLRRNCRPPFRGEALKIVTQLKSEETAKAIAARYGCRVIRYRGEDRYSFLPEGAGKAEGVQILAAYLGVPMSQVAAFGDDLGDIKMLCVCGLGVAVANAAPEVRAAADAVCGPCDQDGVAGFLENMLKDQAADMLPE